MSETHITINAAGLSGNIAEAGAEIERVAAEQIAPAAALIDDAFAVAAGSIQSNLARAAERGDTWESEVPISEAAERYAVTIYDGETIVREAETTTAAYLYAAADMLEDSGPAGPGDSLSFAVAQISDEVGAGASAKRDAAIE